MDGTDGTAAHPTDKELMALLLQHFRTKRNLAKWLDKEPTTVSGWANRHPIPKDVRRVMLMEVERLLGTPASNLGATGGASRPPADADMAPDAVCRRVERLFARVGAYSPVWLVVCGLVTFLDRLTQGSDTPRQGTGEP